MILCPSSVCQSAEIPWKEEDEGTGGHETKKKSYLWNCLCLVLVTGQNGMEVLR